MPDGSNLTGHALGAYANAFAQNGSMGSSRDAALSAGMADQITQLRARIADGSMPDPTGEFTKQLNVATNALLSKDAYFKQGIAQMLPAGVTRLSGEGLNPLSITDQELHSSKGSGFQAAAYLDANRTGLDGTTAGSYVVAFKGTASLEDAKNDIQQGIGLKAQQYQEAKLLADAIANSGAAGNVEYSGHSLGGGLASLAALVGNTPATTFNAAGLKRV